MKPTESNQFVLRTNTLFNELKVWTFYDFVFCLMFIEMFAIRRQWNAKSK